METDPHNISHGPPHYHGLEAGVYTAEKLRYASAKHMHMTSRRYFIGPIPKSWLQNHRKSWYKARLNSKHYSSKAVTFSAESEVAHYLQSPGWSESSELQRARDDHQAGNSGDEGTDQDQESTRRSTTLRTLDYPLGEANDIPSASGSEVRPSLSSEGEHNVESESRAGDAGSSFVTAREHGPSSTSTNPITSGGPTNQVNMGYSQTKQSAPIPQVDGVYQSSPMVPSSETGSEAPLLGPKPSAKGKGKLPTAPSTLKLELREPQHENIGEEDHLERRRHSSQYPFFSITKKATKLNLEDNFLHKQQRFQSRLSKTRGKISDSLPYRRKMQEGEIIKTERMLVRVEETMQQNLPHDYSEQDSLKMDTRVVDNWREYLVVCRATSDPEAPFALQMYKTHVIPKIQKKGGRISPYHEVTLGKKHTRVNLYSSLDKTIVIWGPSKHGTKIYIVRPKSTVRAVEWYTYIFQALGSRRPTSLSINAPDLGLSLVLRNPFSQGTKIKHQTNLDGTLTQSTPEDTCAAISIVRGCMEMLENRTELSDVLQKWSKTEKMGLAWKRYDRLEWIYGANEKEMYGTLAMQDTHELELRPRQHYHTFVRYGDNKHEEPEPVEGFLVRLTSQRGVHQRMNKMFFKRLYFFCQDHYLFFCRPAKSLPPAPSKLCPNESDNIPSTQAILDEMPLSYAIDPYPIQDGEITWLSGGNKEHIKKHDEEAYAQLRRVSHNLSQADGYIDLCQVQEVRHVRYGSYPAEPNIQEGPGVAFHPEARDTSQDDGATQQFEDDRTFEMLMDNGLIVRLQAYDTTTKKEWMKRLDALVTYWKSRTAADAAELKEFRQRNVDIMNIDEEFESIIGQFAKKWEVRKAQASPHLHNMCSLSGCRAIKMSGQLYRKPRRHSTFKRCDVVLVDGKLLIFRSSLRKHSGVEVPHIHSSLETTILLADCYIYSGLLAESDLLYTNQTFDSNHPGHRTLPRVYLSTDLYNSTDEDTAITFVIWQPLRKNLFRAIEGEQGQKRQVLKQVPKLGVLGRTVVFKARSRVEKDRWVLSIASEIDRLQEEKSEDIRIV